MAPITVCKTPKVRITAPYYGPIPTRFLPTHVSLKSGVFDGGGATLDGFEPFPTMDITKMAGSWLIAVDDDIHEAITYHYGLDNRDAERLKTGYNGSLTLSDQLEEWKLPLIQKSYNDATVGGLLATLTAEAGGLSGVYCDTLVTNTTALSDVCDGGVFLAANSTRLEAIQEILQWLGYVIYAVPETGRLTILAPCYKTPLGNIDVGETNPRAMTAKYGIRYKEIHSDVVVANMNTGTGKITGQTAATPDLTNYNISKKVNPFLAEVWQLKDDKLQAMADELYKLDRQAAQGLTVQCGGVLGSCLWKQFPWNDLNHQYGGQDGGGTLYKVVSATVDIVPTSVSTTLEAMVV